MSDQVAEMSATYLVEAAQGAVPMGYKQTEVGVIPEDWMACELGQAITFQRGFDLPQRLREVGNIPIISSSGASGWHNTAAVKAPSIVTGRYGTIGNIFYLQEDFWPLNTTLYVREFKKLLPEYALYILRTVDFASHSGKSGVPGVNRNDLHQEKIAVPPIEEQTAIANALSDVDALISELEKLIAKKQAIKTATMQQLLTGRTRLPQFSLRKDGTPKGYKQSELGEIPEDWETVPFRNLLSIRHGKNQKIVEEENGNYPIFATGGRIGWANSYLWDKPSVLIGRKGTINKPRYADKPFWTVDTLFYSEISPHADAKFIYFKFCMVDWMQYNEASGVPSLSTNTIESILTTAPVKEEQTAIANVLSDMDKEIQALEQRLGKTRQIKQSMMQELLTGKTRLPKGENND